MIDLSNFKIWLGNNNCYSVKTISNIISRFKRANKILPWYNDTMYIFQFQQTEEYRKLSVAVRSQLNKSIKLYSDFICNQETNVSAVSKKGMKILSLFANIGVAEAYLEDMGFKVVLANEIIERRAVLYSKIYPKTEVVCGDITDKKVFNKIVNKANEYNIDIIMATPPCQGMSTVGQMAADDARNTLVCQVVEAVKEIKPKYVMIENVPSFFSTKITVKNKKILIPDLLCSELGGDYSIHRALIDTKDYSVPQNRERAIVLMTRHDQELEWIIPKKEKHIITMRDAIGDLPKLDPFITDVSEKEMLEIVPNYYERETAARKISRWHIPPHHIKRQVVAMQHTPSGETAFDNNIYYPVKADGKPVKGFRNTYKRQNWDAPAYTVTMDNRKISSQNNVHPGRKEYVDNNGNCIYSDARVLTLYEIMRIMSIPDNWPIPDDTSEAFLRRIIGEGIPPLFVKKTFESLK